MECIAIFDYESQLPEELDLKVGDIITGAEQLEHGWLKGFQNGKLGSFPENYVNVRKVHSPSKLCVSSNNSESHSWVTATTKNQMDSLDCGVCFTLPRRFIFQCVNGHILCDTCTQEISACPQCRIELKVSGTFIRNRALEQVIAYMNKGSCSFKSKGCFESSTEQNIKDHEKLCIYSGNAVELCRIIGYPCAHRIVLDNLPGTLMHLQKHGAIQISSNSGTLCLQKFQNQLTELRKENVLWGMWNPVVLHHEGRIFMVKINIRYHDQTSFLMVKCIQLDSAETNLPSATICVASTSPSVLPIQWDEPTVPLQKVCSTQVALRLPTNGLRTYYCDDNDNLIIHVSIGATKTNAEETVALKQIYPAMG